MSKVKVLTGILLLAGMLDSSAAMAHGYWHGRGHVGVGLYFGGPFGYPYYNPYPYYYPPVVVAPAPVYPAQPPVYIEQSQQNSVAPQSSTPPSTQAQQSTNYWYHCDNPDGYYPYIKDCPAGWVAVPATPPQR